MFKPFAHNPVSVSVAVSATVDGRPRELPVRVIEFTDLSCVQCMGFLEKTTAVQASQPKYVELVNIHMPVARYNETNLAAFYGKVAQRAGLFWAYREKLIALKDVNDTAYFEALLAAGTTPLEARRLMMTEARRFYRELDADTKLARSLQLSNPPHAFVNGIHVGQNGIEADKLADVVTYQLNAAGIKLDTPAAVSGTASL